MSYNLGIRARRSRTTNLRKNNAITDHTLDDDLVMIREYAKRYDDTDPDVRKILDKYVFPGKTLDYYYGNYISMFHAFVMAHQSKNEMAPALVGILHAISKKIVTTIDEAKKEIEKADTIHDVKQKI